MGRPRKLIIHVVERAFVKGACIPSVSLEILGYVRFAMQGLGKRVEEFIKRVEVNDARAMYVLGSYYSQGSGGLQQDRTKANELFVRAADLDYSKAHFSLGLYYRAGGDLKKAKFHYEAAAMAGHEGARCNIGAIEAESGKRERAVKHWIIAASAGEYNAMHNLLGDFEQGLVSRDTFD